MCHVFIGLLSYFVTRSVLPLVVYVMCIPIVLYLSPHVCHMSLSCIEERLIFHFPQIRLLFQIKFKVAHDYVLFLCYEFYSWFVSHPWINKLHLGSL